MKKIILLITVLLITSCGFGQQPSGYYQGTEGIRLSFEPGSPPSEMYFIGSDVNRDQFKEQPNKFEVTVRVHNTGASLTKGGIYLSGYDKTILEFDVDKERKFFNDCGFSLGGLGIGQVDVSEGTADLTNTGRLGFSFGCRHLDIGAIVNLEIGNFGNDLGLAVTLDDLGIVLDNLFNTQFFSKYGLDDSSIRFQLTEDGYRLDVGLFDEKRIGERGEHFLALWAPYDFSLNGGRPFELQADDEFFPGGEEEFITFYGEVIGLPGKMNQITQPLMVTACYLYTTRFTPTVCVSPYGVSQVKKVCSPGSVSTKTGQGAPIAVTSVSQSWTTFGYLFTIDIENVGGGMVYSPLRLAACNPNYPLPVTPFEIDQVLVARMSLGGDEQRVGCVIDDSDIAAPNFAFLSNGKATLNCFYDMSGTFYNKDNDAVLKSASGYKTPLLIELWYGYSQTIKADLPIYKLRGVYDFR